MLNHRDLIRKGGGTELDPVAEATHLPLRGRCNKGSGYLRLFALSKSPPETYSMPGLEP